MVSGAASGSDLTLGPGSGDTLRVDLSNIRGGRSGRARGRGDRQKNSRDGRNKSGAAGNGIPDVSSSTLLDSSSQATIPPGPGTEANTPGTQEEDDSDSEVCFICASPVVHNSIAPCNHRTCHICSLRMRALYKSKACPHCRTAADRVIFTDEPEKRYEDYLKEDFARQDDVLGINYEKLEIFEDTLLLLRYNCPDADCDVACLGWPDLHRHVKATHHKAMCDLCTRNKKVFTHEHELFTKDALRKHEKFGDDNPGAIDQSGFTGHPECGFCRQRFYGEDELFAHCREKHERCHVCDARNPTNRPQYYQNYDALETHFRKDHFPCMDRECLEKKFVVFGSEMDLKAHQIEVHPNGLTKDARRVDISSFDYRTPHQEPARQRRDRGRGRDPNSEPLPVTSAQPLRRDQIAYQRTLAIQSAQSTAPRTFGGQLTQGGPPSIAAPSNNRPVQPSATSSTAAASPQDQARQLRHASVTQRAADLLGQDASKMTEFRDKVSAFRTGAIKARTLIESFFSLFDAPATEIGKLIQELAEIFEITARKDELLRSWFDWKAINEDYPSLPGPSGHNTTNGSGSTYSEARILKLKSSTAQSGRNAVSRQGRWTPAANGKTTPSVSFPALSSTSLPSRPVASSSAASKPSWSQSNSATASRSAAAPAMKAASPAANAFPALPAAQKPYSTIFSPGYTGRGIKRITTPASENYWSASQNSASANGEASEQAAPDPSTKKKGGKGKKQVLYAWG